MIYKLRLNIFYATITLVLGFGVNLQREPKEKEEKKYKKKELKSEKKGKERRLGPIHEIPLKEKL